MPRNHAGRASKRAGRINGLKEIAMFTRRQFIGRCLVAGSLSLVACSTSAPVTPTQAPPSPTQPPAAQTAAPGVAGATQYKLDLGGYRGPAPTSQQVQIRFMRQSYTPAT